MQLHGNRNQRDDRRLPLNINDQGFENLRWVQGKFFGSADAITAAMTAGIDMQRETATSGL